MFFPVWQRSMDIRNRNRVIMRELTTKEKEDIASEAGRFILRPIAIIQAFFLVALVSVPFIFIWGNSDKAMKLLWTSLIAVFVLGTIHYFIKRIFIQLIDDEIKELTENKSIKKKSTFQERIKEAKSKNQN